jgi:hypothetical protein
MPEIKFPVTLDYVSDWGPWEVTRELATNALDSDPGFRMGKTEDGTLWIEDSGDNLAIRHLLFGVSEKGAGSIGQFGEGMKLAILVLTRMGLQAHIYSGGKHLWNTRARMQGEQVFKVVWEAASEPRRGTRIEIPNWPHETYEERFLRPGDPRIIHTDPFGRSILEQECPDLFVRGVWVQKPRREYAFGYNLTEVDMNRDRGVVDAWQANFEIGKLWASVIDTQLLERFWRAVKDGMGERGCQMYGLEIANRRGMKHAFQAVYGHDAVLQTSPEMGREAKHRGASPVTAAEVGGYGLRDLVADLVGTDAQHVAQIEGKEKVYLPDKKLAEAQVKALKVLRRLARRVGFSGKILGYVLPPDVRGEAHEDSIRISVDRLGDVEKAIATWLYEQARVEYDTSDATAEHVDAVADVAARVIASYAVR